MPLKVAVIFDRFGPYHVARLMAASDFVSLIPIELFGESTEYKWDKVNGPVSKITIFKDKSKEEVSARRLFLKIQQVLDNCMPDAIAINGWSDKGALSALYWCCTHKVPAIVMSDSTAIDEKRAGWKESIKRKVVKLCSSGLVAGSRHIAYLAELGMHPEAVFTGYDVIDNHYFQHKVAHIRSHEKEAAVTRGLPGRYFLASSRFIPKKNLPLLIKAYAGYRQQAGERPYDLMLLGDGALRDELVQLVQQLHLQHAVHLPGFIQYQELPYYYAFAGAFIHASTSEQWGLVVNEAMAAGLPVVVSERCGCVPDLVAEGVNGFTFDPENEAALTRIMLDLTKHTGNLRQMGAKSQEIISNWQPDQFGKGLQKAAEMATVHSEKSFSLLDRFMLTSLIFR